MAEANNMEANKGDNAHLWVKINLPYYRTTPGMIKLLQLMDNLVTTINKLQEAVALLGPDTLQLPQIVVVGDQSSGKSSLLEGLVGKSFLPRGMGVVTRRPLILQLVGKDAKEKYSSAGDWAVFLHKKECVYTDFNEVRKEIIVETERKVSGLHCISDEPIILKVHSNSSSHLTIVDLPGIVKVPMGDQPSDIEQQVKSLILKYIKNPNSIILAVVTANTDIATSESMKLAREVDPHGDRSLAVITKLDLMDAGTNAIDILSGKVIPMKLGIIGVVNRSQQNTLEGKTISLTLKDEALFLRRNYPDIASKNGTIFLGRKLHSLLLAHIERCLPDVKEKISNNIIHYQTLLSGLGKDISDVNQTLLEILTKFSSTYCSAIIGTHNELETRELSGGARISYIFNETFGRAIDGMDPLSGFSRPAIITAMKNTAGTRPALFIPETCFELLVKKQIQKFEAPSLKCVRLIYEELERILHHCGPKMEMEMTRFPNLYARITEHVTDLIKSRLPETNLMVQNLIKIHSAYVNTGHPDFLKDKMKLGLALRMPFEGDCRQDSLLQLQLEDAAPSGSMEVGVPNDCIVVEKLITSYFNIVKKTVQDCIPKTIMHFLVNSVMDKILSELVSKLYSGGVPPGILDESPDIINKRNEIKALLDAHQKANSVINELKAIKY